MAGREEPGGTIREDTGDETVVEGDEVDSYVVNVSVPESCNSSKLNLNSKFNLNIGRETCDNLDRLGIKCTWAHSEEFPSFKKSNPNLKNLGRPGL